MRRLLALLLLLAAPLYAGASRTFDGTNDVINMGDNLDFARTDPFSLAFWHKEAGTSPTGIYKYLGKRVLGGSHPGYEIGTRGDLAGDPYEIVLADSSEVGSDILIDFPRTNDTAWHCAVMAYSGSSLASGVKFYVDGTAQSPTVIRDSLDGNMVTTATFKLGAGHDGTIQFYPGSLAQVRAYSVELTAAEVSELCKGGGQVYRGLVGYWPLWEVGAAPTYQDLAATPHDGSATNHPAESTDGPKVFFPGGAQ